MRSTLSYVKGLPTPTEEMNALGITKFEEFLYAFSLIYRKAAVETVNYILSLVEFGNNEWNYWKSQLQVKYGINARQANSIICDAKGLVKSA